MSTLFTKSQLAHWDLWMHALTTVTDLILKHVKKAEPCCRHTKELAQTVVDAGAANGLIGFLLQLYRAARDSRNERGIVVPRCRRGFTGGLRLRAFRFGALALQHSPVHSPGFGDLTSSACLHQDPRR